MWGLILAAYIATGLLCTGCMFAVFPPMPGYRPAWSIVLLAVFVYTTFWPVIVLLGTGYLAGRAFCRLTHSAEEFESAPKLRFRSASYDDAHLQN